MVGRAERDGAAWEGDGEDAFVVVVVIIICVVGVYDTVEGAGCVAGCGGGFVACVVI